MSSDRTAFGGPAATLDSIDRAVLAIIQTNCKTPLARIGEQVGLSAAALVERLRKLERTGVIKGYRAVLDARAVGLDVTAFIGVSMNYPKMITSFERAVARLPEVLECHHITGAHSLLIKVITRNTASLEALISTIRSIRGVLRTETMVVFSTRTERTELPVALPAPVAPRPARRARRPRTSSSDSP